MLARPTLYALSYLSSPVRSFLIKHKCLPPVLADPPGKPKQAVNEGETYSLLFYKSSVLSGIWKVLYFIIMSYEWKGGHEDGWMLVCSGGPPWSHHVLIDLINSRDIFLHVHHSTGENRTREVKWLVPSHCEMGTPNPRPVTTPPMALPTVPLSRSF